MVSFSIALSARWRSSCFPLTWYNLQQEEMLYYSKRSLAERLVIAYSPYFPLHWRHKGYGCNAVVGRYSNMHQNHRNVLRGSKSDRFRFRISNSFLRNNIWRKCEKTTNHCIYASTKKLYAIDKLQYHKPSKLQKIATFHFHRISYYN